MKKLNILAGMLIGAATIFTAASCDSDRDMNPTLGEPTTFKLNTPAYANSNVDLATSDSLRFTWSQPDYGFPVAAEYQVQVSVDNQWKTSVDDSIADTSGNTPAQYASVGTPTGVVTGLVGAADLAKALEQLKHWAEGEVPADQNVYARVMAAYAGDTIYSNTVSFKVLPYYVELRDADPIIYYLVGGCIADGNWTNSQAAIGTSLIPLLPAPGAKFDKATGAGEIEWYGHMPENADFKIVFTPGDWDNGICGKDGADMQTSLRIGGGDDPGNIHIANEGYYHITVNTNTDYSKVTCKIEKMATAPAVNAQMLIAGDFNSWGTTTNMTAINTNDVNKAFNHDWTYSLDASNGDTTAKFLADPGWATNWGATDFPFGTGTGNGPNIPVKAGNYKIFFNDISGTYYFFAQ